MNRVPVCIGYFKSSISEEDRSSILRYARIKKLGTVMFVEETADIKNEWAERKIGKILNTLKTGDSLIVPEIIGLGKSTVEVLEILKFALKKDIPIHAVKGRLEINYPAMHKETIMEMFSLFSELEREFISIRTKVALEARKAAGVKLGRPKGPGKSKLDTSKNEIIALLKSGSTKAYIAKRYKTTTPNLYNWLKKNNIEVKPDY